MNINAFNYLSCHTVIRTESEQIIFGQPRKFLPAIINNVVFLSCLDFIKQLNNKIIFLVGKKSWWIPCWVHQFPVEMEVFKEKNVGFQGEENKKFLRIQIVYMCYGNIDWKSISVIFVKNWRLYFSEKGPLY